MNVEEYRAILVKHKIDVIAENKWRCSYEGEFDNTIDTFVTFSNKTRKGSIGRIVGFDSETHQLIIGWDDRKNTIKEYYYRLIYVPSAQKTKYVFNKSAPKPKVILKNKYGQELEKGDTIVCMAKKGRSRRTSYNEITVGKIARYTESNVWITTIDSKEKIVSDYTESIKINNDDSDFINYFEELCMIKKLRS